MAYTKGTYNINVTMAQGCTIDFSIPDAAKSWVHISPESGGSGRYVLTIDDGNHGNTTVGVFVNGNPCNTYDIEVESPAACTCNDLTTTPHAAPATIAQGKSFTLISYSSPNNCIEVVAATPSAGVDWFAIDSYDNGSVVGHVTKDNETPGTKTGTVSLTIQVKGGKTCTNAVQVSISQSAPGCVCEELTISSVPAFEAAGSQNATLATNLNFGCLVNTGITFEQNDWITSTAVTNGSITGKVATYSNATTPRTVTITVTGKTSASAAGTCSKTATVTQNPPSCTPSTCYTVSEATANVSATATKANVTWTYTETRTDANCQTTTQTGSESKEVEFAAVTDCSQLTKSGDFTWEGHTACGGSSNVNVHWTVYQDKPDWCDCSCSNITVSSDKEFDHSAHPGETLGTITFDSCVTDTGITWNWDGETPWISSTGYSQNTLTGNIESYGSFTTNRSVTISATGNTATQPGCSQSFTITQTKNTVSCNCEDLEVTDTLDYGAGTTKIVDWTSSADWASDETGSSYAHIISYQIPADKASCFENVTIDIEPDEDYDEDVFSITPTSDGKGLRVYIKEEFETDMEAFITFKYTMSDGQSCRATGRNYISVFYKAACNCDKIYGEGESCIRKTAPTTSLSNFVIADGETNGCGYFSGYTSASNLKITKIGTNSRGEVYINADSCDNGKAGAIQIFFVSTVGGNKQCGGTRTLTRTTNYVSCERFANATFSASYSDMTYTDTDTVRTLGYVWKSNGEAMYEGMKYYADNDLFTFSGPSWIEKISADTSEALGVYIRGLVKGDTGPGGRTGTITVGIKASTAKEGYGICNCTTTKSWTIKEKLKPTDECECDNRNDKTIDLTTYASETSKTYIAVREGCFKEEAPDSIPRYILKNTTGGTITDSNHYQEGQYYTVPTATWLKVAINDTPSTLYGGSFYPDIYYKWEAATTSQREAVVYLISNVDIATECKMKITFKQDPIEEISCSDIPGNKIKGEHNTESKAFGYEDYNSWTIASFDESIEGMAISGEVANPTRDNWIYDVHQGPSYKNKLYASISANTSTRQIGLDFDGVTKTRMGEVRAYLIDSDGHKFVDKNGNTCEGDLYPIYQKGFSGYCPACGSVSVRNDITVDYTGYGHKQCPFDISTPGSEEVPTFSGNSAIELDLFKVKVKSIYQHENTDMRCFKLSAMTDHTDVVSGSLRVDGPTRDGTSNDDIYIVKGKLKPITDKDVSPILIKLYLVKRGFNVVPDEICGGVSEFQEGHIKILKDINGECK